MTVIVVGEMNPDQSAALADRRSASGDRLQVKRLDVPETVTAAA